MLPSSSPRLLVGGCLLLAAALLTTSPTPATALLPAGAQDADTAEGAEARKQIAAGDYEAAVELLAAWLERNPDDPGVRRFLARTEPVGGSGEVAGRIDRFPDGNEIRHAWAWVLAPLWSKGRSAVRVPGGSTTGGEARTVDLYDPYYTPEDIRIHSALLSLQAGLSEAVLLAADGSVGVDAREDAPSLDVAPGSVGPPALSFSERDFTPWRLRTRLSAELSPASTPGVEAGYRKDAFWKVWHASPRLEWRFLGGLRSP